MDAIIAARLLESIEMDRLVILCGAGLSTSSPSNLPSAKELANFCFDKYENDTGCRLPDSMRNNLEELAMYFWQGNNFKTTFIQSLIPWPKLFQDPNPGHFAVADFLGCGVIEFALTTNIDYLIEKAAGILGEADFQSSIGNDDIDCYYIKHRQLIKIHGCSLKDRNNTIWCPTQIHVDPMQQRTDSIRRWLMGRLQSKDILIIGFWSDWAYLNGILDNCINGIVPNTVYLVDPLPDPQLEEKAPNLWRWARNENSAFFHIQESGDNFLDEIRKKYSIQFLKKMLDLSKQSYRQRFGQDFSANIHIEDTLGVSVLYEIRRNVSGTPINEIVRSKKIDGTFELIGLFHLWMVSMGAIFEPPYFKYANKFIRLINTPGKMLSTVKRKYSHEPIHQLIADITVCVGAGDDYSPADIVKGDKPANIIRSGLSGKWITEKDLPSELGVQLQ
jgi:NAD-dependent SIR2 family protein deacetylase